MAFRGSYTYLYPNEKSYNQLTYDPRGGPGYGGRALRHGYLFGYKEPSLAPPPATGQTEPTVPATQYRHINYENSKMFQFNPPALGLDLSMYPAENPDTNDPAGNLPTPALGVAKTKLQMLFDRMPEVVRAGRFNGRSDAVWRDLGVQIDMFDVLKVMSGGEQSLWEKGALDTGETDSPFTDIVRKGSLNYLSGMMLDAAVTGAKLFMKPFVIVFSPNLAVHVIAVSSFSFQYLRFTADMVPTTLQIDLELEVSNMGTKAYASNIGSSTTPPTPTTPPPGVTPPPGQTEPVVPPPGT